MASDIIARLRLSGTKFTEDTRATFSAFNRDAVDSSQQAKVAFETNFAEIQATVRKALKMQPTGTGAIDLDVASRKASAGAAQAEAATLRDLATAAERVAINQGDASAATRLYIQAAQAAANEAEQNARALATEANAYEKLQIEMNAVRGVMPDLDNRQRKAAATSGALRSAMQGASYQVQDLFTQISMGANPIQAFVVQGGQLAGQFSMVEGRAGKLASFFIGPWGLALSAALLVVSKLTEGIFDESEAHKAAREAAEKHRDAVLELARAQEKAILTGERKQAIDVAEIQNELQLAMATRTRLAASLASAKADLERSKNLSSSSEGGVDVGTTVGATIDRQIAALTDAIKANDASIVEFRKGIDIGFSRLVGMKVDARSTPEGEIRARYERQRADKLADPTYQGTANAGRLADALRKLNEQRDRELKAIEKRTTKRDADTATPSSVASLLRSALPGVQITATTNGKHVSGSDHYKGAAIDFVPKGGMGSMTKADVRAIFERAGVPIRRNAAGVEQLFGPGDKGHADHFHVAWEKGKLALDNYRASVRETGKAQRELERDQRELEQSLTDILKALDPLATATARYNDRLADLAKLKAGGKITLDQQLDYGRDAQRVFGEDKSKIEGDRFRDIFGADQVDAISAQWEDNVRDATAEWGRGLEEGAERATDVLRSGAGQIAEMLGLRVSGPLGAILNGSSNRLDGKQAVEWSERLAKVGVKIEPASVMRIGEVIGNANLGQLGGGTFASITGGKKSALGSSIGGALGGEAGKALGPAISSAIGGTLGKSLGSAAGPLGAIAGGILGNVIGGLFAKTKKGSSTLTFGADGISAGAATGNSGSAKAAAAAGANNVGGALNRIAEALGGELTGAGSVSFGKRKDKFVVDTTGSGRTKGAGTLSFDSEEEAIRAAIADALRDGVVGGISDAAKRILAAGGDLEKAITKATLIEAVPKDLKAMLDPVGAAVDDLNRKFQKTVDALKEGGASSEQMTQAQRLYDLQLEQVKSSTASASAGLKDFLKSLKIGSDSPLSLRDQENAALAELRPFLAKIEAGQSIDQAKYQDAAKSYLDIERQIYGSTSEFFRVFDLIQSSTEKAVATIDAAQGNGESVASPFAKATADSAAATASGVQTGNEIAAEQTDLLARIAAAVEGLGGDLGSAGDFIGGGRLFASQVAR